MRIILRLRFIEVNLEVVVVHRMKMTSEWQSISVPLKFLVLSAEFSKALV